MTTAFRKQKTPYDGPLLSWFYVLWRKFNNPNLHRKLTSEAVKNLMLKHGDSVLEIASGPGYSLRNLSNAVGDRGSVVAIDFSAAMLRQAQKKKERYKLKNVTLLQQDAQFIDHKNTFDGVLSVLGLSVVPAWEQVLRRMVDACKPGGRIIVVDSTKGCPIMSAETRDIVEKMKKELNNVEVTYFVGGLYFVASGTKQG